MLRRLSLWNQGNVRQRARGGGGHILSFRVSITSFPCLRQTASLKNMVKKSTYSLYVKAVNLHMLDIYGEENCKNLLLNLVAREVS